MSHAHNLTQVASEALARAGLSPPPESLSTLVSRHLPLQAPSSRLPSSYFTAYIWPFSTSQAGFPLCEWPLNEGACLAWSGTLSLPSVTSSSHASCLEDDSSQHLAPAWAWTTTCPLDRSACTQLAEQTGPKQGPWPCAPKPAPLPVRPPFPPHGDPP